MYTGAFEPPPPPPLLDMPPPPPPPPPPQVANDVWMKKRARRATAIERKSWFFMARDYNRAGFEERVFDAGSWSFGWTNKSVPGAIATGLTSLAVSTFRFVETRVATTTCGLHAWGPG